VQVINLNIYLRNLCYFRRINNYHVLQASYYSHKSTHKSLINTFMQTIQN